MRAFSHEIPRGMKSNTQDISTRVFFLMKLVSFAVDLLESKHFLIFYFFLNVTFCCERLINFI